MLDPFTTDLASENGLLHDLRLHKTSKRAMYEDAAARGGPNHPEVLLHTDRLVLETCTSNVALYSPGSEGQPDWVTPKIIQGRAAFLNGVVRRELLGRGLIREAEVTLEDWDRCVRKGRPIVGFNGFRCVQHGLSRGSKY